LYGRLNAAILFVPTSLHGTLFFKMEEFWIVYEFCAEIPVIIKIRNNVILELYIILVVFNTTNV